MASTIDEITIKYEEDEVVVVKEIEKIVLSRGAWTTILFRYQQLDRRSNEYGPEKYSLRRYRKTNDEFKQQSKFTISNAEQARKIVEALQQWIQPAS